MQVMDNILATGTSGLLCVVFVFVFFIVSHIQPTLLFKQMKHVFKILFSDYLLPVEIELNY